MTPDVQHLNGAEAASIFEEIFQVYRTVYGVSHSEEDLVNFRNRALTQFQGSGFDLVTAKLDGELIGFAYGLTLRAGSTWWRGIEPTPPEVFLTETGSRTFAVIELVVLPAHQGSGLGRRLMDNLLQERAEERATLATDPDKPGNQAMYERWGWRKAGRVKSALDAPAPYFDLYWFPLSKA